MGVFKNIQTGATPSGGGVFSRIAAKPPPVNSFSGTGWEQKVPVLKQVSNFGTGVGSALGKAVLGVPEVILRAGAGVGSLVGDKEGAANLSRHADTVRKVSDKMYQQPFAQELNTFSGQAGSVAGTVAPYFAGAGVAKTASLFPRVASRAAVDTSIAAAQSGGDPATMGVTGATSAVANLIPIPGKGIFARIAAGAVPGYVADVGSGMAGLRGEERTGANAFIPGAGTAIGIGLGAAPSAIQGIQKVVNRNQPENIVSKRLAGLQQLEDNNAPVRRVIEKHTSKNIDTKKLLAETDLLHNSVDETGTIRTKTAMDELNAFLKEGPETVINKNLEREGVMITLNSLRNTLKTAVQNSGLQGRALVNALKAVDDDIAGYALRADPQGRIPLSLVHAAKVDKYANINYMVPESARGDKVIAKALKETVENNTKSVDVKALNKELQAHYSVLDLLEKLDGRKVAGGKLGKYFAQTVGAVVGSHFGPLGAIVGAEIGGRARGSIMSKTFNGVTGNDVRSSQAMRDAIQKGNSPRTGILPPPPPGGRRSSIEVPIPMRPPNSTEPPAQQINRTTDFKLPQKRLNAPGENPIQLPGQSSKSTGSLNQAQTKNTASPNSQNIPQNTTKDLVVKARELTEKNGGVTITLDGDIPRGGFAFAPLKNSEMVVPKADFNDTHIESFIAKHSEDLKKPDAHLGIWEDDGKIYLDISHVVKDEGEAVSRAAAADQIALFDLDTFDTKYLNKYGKEADNTYTYDGQRLGSTAGGSKVAALEEGAGVSERPASGDGVPTPSKGLEARSANDEVRKGAASYNESIKMPPPVTGIKASVDIPRARKIADVYDSLPVDDSANPAVKKAYAALEKEIEAQWDYITNKMGIKLEPWTKEGQPYANSIEMQADVRDNKHLYFFQGGEPHPLLGRIDPATGLSSNDKFRAVHDVFGHAAEGYSFSPAGEESAWLKHSQMLSDDAQKALTTETRGQNSWVNYGKQNYDGETYKNIPPADRPYAVQKVALLPDEFTDYKSILKNLNGETGAPKSPKKGPPGRATIGTLAVGALGAAALAGGMAGDTVTAVTAGANQVLPEAKARGVELPKGSYKIPDRDVTVSERELDLAKKVLFAEISNRSSEKQKIESFVVLNTALNRAQRRGTTLQKELTRKNQYQGYGSKEYERIDSGKTTAADERKLAVIDEILELIRQGKFRDNLDGNEFYYHNDDGSITSTKEYAF